MSESHTEPCGNDDCDRCDPRPRWRISRHRIQHITYQREIKAASAEEAMRLFEAGTAWPTSYDDDYGEIIQHDDPVIEQITEANEDDASKLAFYREECCYHDLPSQVSVPAKESTE